MVYALFLTLGLLGLLLLTFVIGNMKKNTGCVLTIAAFLQPIGFWVAYFTPGSFLCPYCKFKIPEKATVCGKCQKDLTVPEVISQLKQRKKYINVIGILGVILTILSIVGWTTLVNQK